MQTLCELQDVVIARYGSRRALGFSGEQETWGWSYAELGEQTGRVAAWLAGQGVGPETRVMIWAGNSPWWVAAYFAVLRLGGAVVPLDVRSAPDFVRRVAGQTEPVIGLLDRATAPGWPEDLPSRALDLLADLPPAAAPPLAAVTRDTLAVIAFTSGTTGEPKGVMLTHGNIVANATSVNPSVPPHPEYRLLSVLPLSDMLEQVIGLLVPLLRGGSVTIGQPPVHAPFRAIQEQQMTDALARAGGVGTADGGHRGAGRRDGAERALGADAAGGRAAAPAGPAAAVPAGPSAVWRPSRLPLLRRARLAPE